MEWKVLRATTALVFLLGCHPMGDDHGPRDASTTFSSDASAADGGAGRDGSRGRDGSAADSGAGSDGSRGSDASAADGAAGSDGSRGSDASAADGAAGSDGSSGGCTLSPPTDIDNPSSNPSAAGRPGSLSRAYNNSLALYQSGLGGPWRLLLEESFGYSVLDLTNPASPSFIRWDDLRFDSATSESNPIEQHGDGQSYIQTVAVSPDGQRAAFSVNGPAEPNWHTLVGRPDGNNGFGVWGDTAESRASGTVIQQIGSRYILYSLQPTSPPLAADITTVPSTLSSSNITHETTSWPPGNSLSLAGGFLAYMAGNTVQVLDASNPGPIGSITPGFQQIQISSATVADFGGRVPQFVSANVDPGDPNELWLLVALGPLAGENSPSFGLVSISRNPSTGTLSPPSSAGPAYRVPAAAGETWVNVGPASALVSKNGTLFVLMWSNRRAPTYQFSLFSATVDTWTGARGQAILDPNFSVGSQIGILDGPGDSLYAYAASGDAWVIPMTCQRFR